MEWNQVIDCGSAKIIEYESTKIIASGFRFMYTISKMICQVKVFAVVVICPKHKALHLL